MQIVFAVFVEYISNVDELDNTELNNIPIMICLDSTNLSSLQEYTYYFKNRNDVIQPQLFFHIHPSLSLLKAKRLISDLGVWTPQIVLGINDASGRK